MEQSFAIKKIIIEREQKIAKSKQLLEKAQSVVQETVLEITEQEKELEFFKKQVLIQ